MLILGGIGAFVLSVFHKLESSDRCSWKWFKKTATDEDINVSLSRLTIMVQCHV